MILQNKKAVERAGSTAQKPNHVRQFGELNAPIIPHLPAPTTRKNRLSLIDYLLVRALIASDNEGDGTPYIALARLAAQQEVTA